MLVWLVAVVIASFLCTAGLKLTYRSPTACIQLAYGSDISGLR
jgi:hypothetical protein